jgi:hypothetical protein
MTNLALALIITQIEPKIFFFYGSDFNSSTMWFHINHHNCVVIDIFQSMMTHVVANNGPVCHFRRKQKEAAKSTLLRSLGTACTSERWKELVPISWWCRNYLEYLVMLKKRQINSEQFIGKWRKRFSAFHYERSLWYFWHSRCWMQCL